MNSHWTDRVVLITGASSGIGQGLALELGRRGARVGLLARRQDLLDQLVKEVQSKGGQALALAADVEDVAAVAAVANQLKDSFGPIEVLIANAGIGENINPFAINPKIFRNVLGVNVFGVVNSVAAVVPQMIEAGHGQLVAISSLAAYRGLPKSAAYCASKAAVSILMESLRLDLKPKGIDVTIIHPGFIKTPLTDGRNARMPFLMELDDAVLKILGAIEKRKKSYAFPWQLASIVRAGMIMPTWMYDYISSRNSFRE
jgi:short-subunit dehydrogenase